MLIIPLDNPQGGVAPFVYVPRCGEDEPFLSPSVPDVPLTGFEDRGTWDLRVALPSMEHWTLLEDEAFQQHRECVPSPGHSYNTAFNFLSLYFNKLQMRVNVNYLLPCPLGLITLVYVAISGNENRFLKVLK